MCLVNSTRTGMLLAKSYCGSSGVRHGLQQGYLHCIICLQQQSQGDTIYFTGAKGKKHDDSGAVCQPMKRHTVTLELSVSVNNKAATRGNDWYLG